jgi:4-amino-4-deoxy-L-arabinose transferase-like glycosyltransferase
LKLETRNQKAESGGRQSGIRAFAKFGTFYLPWIFSWLAAFTVLLFLHLPFLRLPYYWDEAGYYIPAAMDFFHYGRLIPTSTLPVGHTPLVVIYLAMAWRAFGLSPLVTRTAMIAVAAGTLAGLYALGRRVANREIRCWSVLLLGLSPLFFAQSALAHIDLPAALFTVLALLALLEDHPTRFALASTAAVLSKETALVLLPVAWIFSWWQRRRATSPLARAWWAAYLAPIAALIAWTAFYHHATGFWTGNRQYLSYNLYSTLHPVRALLTLLRRLYETFVGGFNWLLTVSAIAGIVWARRKKIGANLETSVIPAKPVLREGEGAGTGPANSLETPVIPALRPRAFGQQAAKAGIHSLFFLGGWLTAAYLVMLSVVGGAVLPRYLLPIFPPLVLMAVILIWRLPRPLARSIMVVTTSCFVWAWFLSPPFPFPFEDNLTYADFIRLHERAAQFLQAQAGRERILTAWPASDELARPFLGYVSRPLNVVALQDFGRQDFDGVSPESFDCLYLYSRRWEPANNWMKRFSWLERLQQRYFDYQPEVSESELVARYHLRLLASLAGRRQWARIYVKQ